MRVFCLYRPNTEHERSVYEFNDELTRRYHTEIELISIDTKDGARMASLYEIMQYPAIAVVDGDGRLQHLWADGQLPLLNEVSYYLTQA